MNSNRYVGAFIENARKSLASNEATLTTTGLDLTDKAILQHLGFKEDRPDEDDPAYIEYKMPIGDCLLLKGVEINIAGSLIYLWAKEHERGLAPGQPIVTYARDFNWQELGKLLYSLTKMRE
jgi:hypothetical protein